MFICIDTVQCAGQGATLDEAYKNYENNHNNDPMQKCTFFEAEELQIEIIFKRVETVAKVKKSGD